jgi:hypothetical protein
METGGGRQYNEETQSKTATVRQYPDRWHEDRQRRRIVPRSNIPDLATQQAGRSVSGWPIAGHAEPRQRHDSGDGNDSAEVAIRIPDISCLLK